MYTIRRLAHADLPDLEQMFRAYPHKKYQQRCQGIDPAALAAFFAASERRSLDKAHEEGVDAAAWVARENDALVAFAGLRPDTWHARFYARRSGLERFARIAPFLAPQASQASAAELLETVLAEARRQEVDHLAVRIDTGEPSLTALLNSRDFYLVDTSVKMSVRLDKVPEFSRPAAFPNAALRHHLASDREAIREIAATAHPLNHYFNDPHLDRRDTEDLFAAWVERCIDGLACDVFVAHDRARVLGFAIYLNPRALNKALGTRIVVLDYVCLERAAQASGLGRWLLGETLKRLRERFELAELRTSVNNYPALTCYRDLGFRIVSTDYALHRARGA